MIKYLRGWSNTVIILILLLLGGSFLFYGNVGNVLTGSMGRGSSDYGRIDDQDVTYAELVDAVRLTKNTWILNGQEQQLNQPGGRDQLAQEAWRSLLIQHEADRLHIVINDSEISDAIRKIPFLQKDGAFSPALYQTFLTNLQTNKQISSDALEQVIRQTLTANAVNQALFSALHSAPADAAAGFEKYYGPVQVSTISFDPKSFAPALTVTPAEIEAEYKAHPDNPAYRTPEKRKVDYVIFPLPADQMKLTGKDKDAAIQALGEKAIDFALAFEPEPSASTNGTPAPAPDFLAEATKRGLTAATTDYFTADTPPAGVPPSSSFNTAAFGLTNDNPVSKVIELDNGVAVLHLAGIQPSELRPLADVKDGIDAQLRLARAQQAAEAAAAKSAQDLKAALAKGSDFKAAASALKLDPQSVPPFIPGKVTQADPRLQTLAYVSAGLNPGEISESVPMESDGTIVLVHLDSRAPASATDEAQNEAQFRAANDERLRNAAYLAWASWENHQPGTHPPANLDEYGGVE
jgi:peptidyl-prolyl cis-trans isomerase D